ncbi:MULTISPECIES: 4'-phosphopantetheinyl transferase family protein [unclassified Pseudoalteromonas]|uniref:4'-phosphopantetheinyl transferase family protein n=1 Tax=unclassified Pseudoalteromonas TaxID=194690 RepID=UPI00041AFFB0|nr:MULTISPECIES: 4'-phosphopantetheinyl transferase superfamily protein [unclassified Pseudoalteromonas]HBW98060.1 hypothetical protein [Pseudoalteromonas sp.]KPV97527.1 holo-(acyl carrier protein) synthase 2 [Pseudoalteromonas sp. P1-11]MDC9497605.1 4'-phosphopantetheinyl transferase superfamily protein [Pseudoalteromonas sp. Angola-20]MDC9516849.1 4'-phosphopantetheinyl transferase superfamily protein [Pseudoalteromonas sp. Angola-22]MDC9533257.1 4'-phosphopantetheinyl transferase superfamil
MTNHFFKNTLSIAPSFYSDLSPSNNTILVFNANTLNVEHLDLTQYLSPFELSVINRRKRMQAKQEYLASRILLKQLAKHIQPQYAHIPLNKMSTHFNEECSKLQLHINHTVINTCISHSHGLVGVALNVTKAEFGFDIEKINLKRPFEKLAKHFYHKAEIALITAPLAIKEQAHRFFRIWTLKEALAKATSRPIAQLLSPNVFDEFSLLNLTASSNTITVANEEFDISVAHKKSTDWRCFILNNLDT